MSIKKYEIEAMTDGSLTALERAHAYVSEITKFERPTRLYAEQAGGTVGFPISEEGGKIVITVDIAGARKFCNVHSEILEADLDVLKGLLAQDMNSGQWLGYMTAIISGASGKINGNQAIPNNWLDIS